MSNVANICQISQVSNMFVTIAGEERYRYLQYLKKRVKFECVFVIFPGGVAFDEHLFCHAGSSWLVHWDSLHLPIVSNNCHADISRLLHDDGDDDGTTMFVIIIC